MSEQKTKVCSDCKVEKPIEQFRMVHAKSRGRKYRDAICIDCKRKKDRERMKRICHTSEYKVKYDDWKGRPETIARSVNWKSKSEQYKNERAFYSMIDRAIKYRVATKVCMFCGKVYMSTLNNSKYCSGECANMFSNQKSKELSYSKYGTRRVRKCIVCGNEFDKFLTPHHLTCSDQCNKKHHRKKQQQLKNIYGRNHRKRARYHGVHYEPVNRTKIFDRDNWHCVICGRSTPKKMMGTFNDNAPELDHIIPLSKGGPHTYSNVQCACRECNIAKGDKIIGQMKIAI